MENPDRFNKMSNEQLLLSLRLGNRFAFEAIFERYWKQLYRWGYAVLRDIPVLEKIIQDIFSELWNNIKETYIAELEFHLMDVLRIKIAELYKIRKDLFRAGKT